MKTRKTDKVLIECALDSGFYWCLISLGTRQHVRHSIIVSTLSGRRVSDCSGSSTMHPGLRDARAGAAEGETITQSRGFASREFLDICVFFAACIRTKQNGVVAGTPYTPQNQKVGWSGGLEDSAEIGGKNWRDFGRVSAKKIKEDKTSNFNPKHSI